MKQKFFFWLSVMAFAATYGLLAPAMPAAAYLCPSSGNQCCPLVAPYSGTGTAYCPGANVNVTCNPCTTGQYCSSSTGTCVICDPGATRCPAACGSLGTIPCWEQYCDSGAAWLNSKWCEYGCLNDGCKADPDERFCYSWCETDAPPYVTGIQICDGPENRITLCWDPAGGLTGQQLYWDFIKNIDGTPKPVWNGCTTTTTCYSSCTPLWTRCCDATIATCDYFYPDNCPMTVYPATYTSEAYDSCGGLSCIPAVDCEDPSAPTSTPPITFPTNTPTRTPTPTQTPTPTPTPTTAVQARARIIPQGINSCQEIIGNTFQDSVFELSTDGTKNSTGLNYAKWDPISDLSQTMTVSVPLGYEVNYTCRAWTEANDLSDLYLPGGIDIDNSLSKWSSLPLASFYTPPGGLFTWELVYKPTDSYFQCRGGDAYGRTGIDVVLSSGLDPARQLLSFKDFGQTGTYLSDGVLMSEDDNDISVALGTGLPDELYLSSAKWQAGVILIKTAGDYYDEMFTKITGIVGTTSCNTCNASDLGNDVTDVFAWADEHKNVVYLDSPAVIDTDFKLADNKKVIFVINSTLNINARVLANCTDCFLGFIVSGNITIDPDVGSYISYSADGTGGEINSSTADLQGIYLTNGVFNVPSAGDGSEKQLVVYGTVVAGGITLSRFNGTITPNYPMVIFRYNPRLLLTMPEIMQKTALRWEQTLRPTPTPTP